MEYILLMFIVIITISKLRGLKHLFKSRESYKKDLSVIFDKAEKQYGKDAMDIELYIVCLLQKLTVI